MEKPTRNISEDCNGIDTSEHDSSYDFNPEIFCGKYHQSFYNIRTHDSPYINDLCDLSTY